MHLYTPKLIHSKNGFQTSRLTFFTAKSTLSDKISTGPEMNRKIISIGPEMNRKIKQSMSVE